MIGKAHLHQKRVLVAVELEHVVVDDGSDAGLGLAVQGADAFGGDAELRLNGVDQAEDIWGDLKDRRLNGCDSHQLLFI